MQVLSRQLWPVRQKLSQLNRLKICHFLTQITRVNKFTQLPTTIFFMKTLVINPFSVGRHFNQTRLVWVKANKLFLFDFATVLLQQERCWVSKKWG